MSNNCYKSVKEMNAEWNITSYTETYKKAIEKFGSGKQFIKSVEELAELQQAIIKKFLNPNIENDNLFEEIADVEIMLSQIKIMYDCHDIIDKVKKQKIERLERLLSNG